MATVTRGRILRGDLANWDGKTATASRVDATGGTITGLAIGNEVDVLQVFGAGSSRTGGSLAAAVAKIGSSYAALVLAPGTWAIDEDLTVPSNLQVKVPAGAILDVAPGKTLTFSGFVEVEDPTIWISGSGSVVVSKDGSHGSVYHRTLAERTAGVTPTKYEFPPGDVRRYGGDPTGVADSATAWTSNIAQASSGGVEMTGPGTYLLATGLTISTDGVKLRTSGMGPTTFKAGANNLKLLKIAASYCSVSSLTIDGNGYTGCDGLVLAPSDETDTTHTTQCNFNEFSEIQLYNLNTGLRLRAGPTVTGVDSGVFYNKFDGVWQRDCVRSIWFQDSVNAGSGSPNRNTFFGCRGGSSASVCNTGLQIDAGGTNSFVGCAFEGISNGSSPNATPTAVKIASAASSGADNNDNVFISCFMEACTRDLDNSNSYSHVVGGVWSAAKFGGGAVAPHTMIGVSDASVAPVIIPGMQYGEGLSGYPSAYWGMTKEIADTGKLWQTYALSTSNITNTTTVANASSYYRQLANVVDWHFTLQFNATGAGTQLNITPPVTPASLYTGLNSKNPFYTFWVNDGTGTNKNVEVGWTNTGKLYVNSPGAWNTAGNNNSIAIQVSYHA
jgi:hypothetical protein